MKLRHEITYRLIHLIIITLLPLIIPGYVLLQALKAFFDEIPKAFQRIAPVVKEVPEGIRIIFSPRRTL